MISRHDARAPASTELPWWSRPIVVPGWPYLVMVGIVAVGFTFCGPKSMSWDAIEGQVVDSQTQQPIAGAAVVAAWSLAKWGLSHPRDAGTIMAIEVRTDASGRYRIPKWGPRGYEEGYLDAKSPQVFVIRAGYQPVVRTVWGGVRGESAPRSDVSSERVWQMPHIGLDRAANDRAVYARAVDEWWLSLRHLGNHSDCDWWSSFKQVHAELTTIGDEMEAMGVRIGFNVPLSRLWVGRKYLGTPCDTTEPLRKY